jgi:hypothetical protein
LLLQNELAGRALTEVLPAFSRQVCVLLLLTNSPDCLLALRLQDELAAATAAGALTEILPAFSRQEGVPKTYVQVGGD